jgi:signal transduction histidine kinase
LSAAAGPPIATVGASSGAASETVILAVTDDGPGFPPGAAARAFERFYRADPARAGAGSGLGLAIVREFALAHGGVVHAENVAPRGARVSVVLPRIPPAH